MDGLEQGVDVGSIYGAIVGIIALLAAVGGVGILLDPQHRRRK